MNWADALFVLAFWGITIPLLTWALLTAGAVTYAWRSREEAARLAVTPLARVPFVTVMVPAHNEQEAIEDTVVALGALDHSAASSSVGIARAGVRFHHGSCSSGTSSDARQVDSGSPTT